MTPRPIPAPLRTHGRGFGRVTKHAQEISERFARLSDQIAHDQIARGAWEDAQGRACLILALAPEVTILGDLGACPAWLLPDWLVHLTPWIDDRCSLEAWPATIRRYADVVGRAAHVLDAAAWRRCDYAARRAAVVSCREHAPDVCDPVIALCDRVLGGDEPHCAEWEAAQEAAAEVRAWAWSAPWAWAWSETQSGAAPEAAADRIIAAIFDAIEHEIAKVHTTREGAEGDL